MRLGLRGRELRGREGRFDASAPRRSSARHGLLTQGAPSRDESGRSPRPPHDPDVTATAGGSSLSHTKRRKKSPMSLKSSIHLAWISISWVSSGHTVSS